MAAEQIILGGFHIDVYPYPNEEAAIPLTNVSREEAGQLCQEQDKRLCSELEWERACKGPHNTIYEYGDRYDAERCATGKVARLLPSGLHVGCRSGFGVRDLHGSAWEWTASDWGRGTSGDRVALRGGDGVPGELVARCAHATPRLPSQASGEVGFRCCAGPENSARVAVRVEQGPVLEAKAELEARATEKLLKSLPDTAGKQLAAPEAFQPMRAWIWRPIGNEVLLCLGGCARREGIKQCGVVLGRRVAGRIVPTAWVSSGEWPPTLKQGQGARALWLRGGAKRGSFRRLVRYEWGRVAASEPQFKVPRARSANKQRGSRKGR